jgi:hypothetical protein
MSCLFGRVVFGSNRAGDGHTVRASATRPHSCLASRAVTSPIGCMVQFGAAMRQAFPPSLTAFTLSVISTSAVSNSPYVLGLSRTLAGANWKPKARISQGIRDSPISLNQRVTGSSPVTPTNQPIEALALFSDRRLHKLPSGFQSSRSVSNSRSVHVLGSAAGRNSAQRFSSNLIPSRASTFTRTSRP